jgi:hypothetical protein
VQVGAVVVALAVLAALLIYRDSQIALRCTDLNATEFLNCNQGD